MKRKPAGVVMRHCTFCKQRLPGGSKYCPRCGNVIDDGLGRGKNLLRVVLGLLLGLTALMLLVGFFFTARKVRTGLPAAIEESARQSVVTKAK